MADSNNTVKNSKNNADESPFSLLTETQWRYITAMLENPKHTKKQVAEYLGIKDQTIYNWTQTDPHVDEALQLARADVRSATIEMQKQALMRAMSVKIALLDSEDENVRSKVASEIIEWQLGKATQRNELTGADGGDMVFKLVYPDSDA